MEDIVHKSRMNKYDKRGPAKQGRLFELKLGQDVSINKSWLTILLVERTILQEQAEWKPSDRQICNLLDWFDCQEQSVTPNRHPWRVYVPIGGRHFGQREESNSEQQLLDGHRHVSELPAIILDDGRPNRWRECKCDQPNQVIGSKLK